MIPAREIRPPDGPLKDHITHKGDPRDRFKKDDVSRCVPRAQANLKCEVADRHFVVLIQPAGGGEWLSAFHTKLRALFM